MLRQFIIPNRINKFGVLRLVLFNCLVGSILSELINVFIFSIANSTSKAQLYVLQSARPMNI